MKKRRKPKASTLHHANILSRRLGAAILESLVTFFSSIYTLRQFVEEVNNGFIQNKTLSSKMSAKVNKAIKTKGTCDDREIEPGPEETKVELTLEEAKLLNRFLNKEISESVSSQNLLSEMAFIYLIALFDAIMSDILMLVFVRQPKILSSSKQLKYEKIIQLINDDIDIVDYMAKRESHEFAYKSLEERIRFYQEKFNIDLAQSGVTAMELLRIATDRNFLVHHNGKINDAYLEILPDTKYKVGQRVVITTKEWLRAVDQIGEVVCFFGIAMIKKFDPQFVINEDVVKKLIPQEEDSSMMWESIGRGTRKNSLMDMVRSRSGGVAHSSPPSA
ncbi:hypothetical protein [Alloacidobacterium sp.]|uniref:hypothetical protein n=1 Tax=Alloacidobacterium sp. TaxID=2951999 RepID=UPI002D41D647|nr:hypothetical protein [Alloacidobacterium sp.]HYK35167.1 hypothetical protein [Alloacidobacterium sp.]